VPHPAPDRRDHEVLLKTTLDDAVKGLAAGRPRAARAAFRLGLMPLARRFRREIEDADELIGRLGLAAGADQLLRVYSGPVAYSGLERIPAEGALVVVANHPGTVDTPAVMASLAVRRDLKVLALDRPFLRAVPHLAAHLLYIGESVGHRGSLVRRAADHLRSGGAVLTFPAGEIEPDPALRRADAVAALASWSRSPELLARLVPGTVVVPVAVEGVVSRRALRSPLARRQRTRDDRELAAATLQILLRDRTIRPRLVVGEPLRGRPDAAALASAMTALIGQAAGS